MDDIEFRKYVNLIASMCVDFLMGSLSRKTFISNLEIMVLQIKESDNNAETGNSVDNH